MRVCVHDIKMLKWIQLNLVFMFDARREYINNLTRIRGIINIFNLISNLSIRKHNNCNLLQTYGKYCDLG